MSFRGSLAALTASMQREGIRRLLVLSGDAPWSQQEALALRDALPGDWLWVGPQPISEPSCQPSALVTLLGREFRHAVFDARRGFDAAAFAALAGTLQAGSWLVLLVPPFTEWPNTPDNDSLRWSDTAQAIATPHFVAHFCRVILQDSQTLVWRQESPFTLPEFPPRPTWTSANGEPDSEQQEILQTLADCSPGVMVVTAERGRGKSALAGMHIRSLAGSAMVTAPARAATDVMARFAGDAFQFMAPDALLASEVKADWLIVDEAAAIPAPLLQALVARFPRTLLTTTVQGYEGTGRGFLLKFCAGFPKLRYLTLSEPVRWASGCPLEAVVSQALLFDDESFSETLRGPLKFCAVEPEAWFSAPELPQAMYQLLSGAHYRTSPLDLRRMMDAPGQHFMAAQCDTGLAGALWLVDEGNLSEALSRAVWAGFRRPRGNLVAQSLAAHGGSPLAATLSARRVTRIAVHPSRQREGTGQALIAQALVAHQDVDYLSVSFGYTPALWRFWQRCGFTLARIGTHREASSGCYTAMALLPLSTAGKALARHEHQRLRRDALWLAPWLDEKLPLEASDDAMLNDDDWQELASFAFAHRPLMTAIGCLNRLLLAVDLPLPALRGRLQQRSETALCAELGLHGRKALLVRLREEARQALMALDAARTDSWRHQINQLQFF
ncbi:tRNA(Met) cytidine acetyltransferase TmcA [Yokenella regensburgei]|uniref:tRNA(Met) cytidine acetyltransferase TmcA n=1 Tax=Yokenella regensburgei TaxID=158877 RepID=UPI003EDB3178